MAEIYVNIAGFPNYQVSNFGNVKNMKTGRVLKQISDGGGYKKVDITNNDGKKETKRVHNLMAKAFIPNPENKCCVIYNDRNRENNTIANLKWSTRAENNIRT